MAHQYESFRGVLEGTPISDHKEFTGFIQRWVSHQNDPNMIIGIDLASGQDKTILAEVKRDDDGTLELTGRTSEIHFVCANAECERELIDKSNIYCSLECERKAIDEA